MSLGIIIGSDVDDIQNLSDTIKILTLTKESFDTPLGQRLDTLIDWYTGIHTLLTDPSSFPVSTDIDSLDG